MKKLRLLPEEWEKMLQSISMKYHEDCKGNVLDFEYTKKDVEEFLKDIETNTIRPTLFINTDAYVKMYELVKQSSVEIQWHMLVNRNLEKNEYTIYDVLVFPQTNSGTSTTSDQNEFAKWQTDLIKDLEFPIHELRGHGHSHVNMNVYSSGIDDAYQRDLITKVENGDYYVFLILNKKMEMFALIYDFANQLIYETKDMDIIIKSETEYINQWAAEQIKENCKTKSTYRSSWEPKHSNLKLDAYKPKEDELIVNINKSTRQFGRKKK